MTSEKKRRMMLADRLRWKWKKMKEAQKGNNMKQLFKSPAFLKKLVSSCLAKTEVSQPHKNCLSNLGVDWMEASQSLQILQICCHMYIYIYIRIIYLYCNIYLCVCGYGKAGPNVTYLGCLNLGRLRLSHYSANPVTSNDKLQSDPAIQQLSISSQLWTLHREASLRSISYLQPGAVCQRNILITYKLIT